MSNLLRFIWLIRRPLPERVKKAFSEKQSKYFNNFREKQFLFDLLRLIRKKTFENNNEVIYVACSDEDISELKRCLSNFVAKNKNIPLEYSWKPYMGWKHYSESSPLWFSKEDSCKIVFSIFTS